MTYLLNFIFAKLILYFLNRYLELSSYKAD